MTPYSRSDHRIHSNRWLVENEEFWIVEQSHGEGQSPLLSSAQIRHSPGGLGQVKKVKKFSLLLLQSAVTVPGPGQFLESAEVFEGLPDGELRVEADVLRHEAHEAAGQAEAAVPGAASEHGDVPGLEALPPEDAGQQRGLAAPARAQQSIDSASPEDI